MSYHLLVSLDTESGVIKRYRRGACGKAEKLGQDFFRRWSFIRRDDEQPIYNLIQAFRASWEPPQDPTPTAPPTMRMARAA